VRVERIMSGPLRGKWKIENGRLALRQGAGVEILRPRRAQDDSDFYFVVRKKEVHHRGHREAGGGEEETRS
jgi:hypothetical protein